MGANSNPRSTVRVGTRGSRLALIQTELTLNILRAAHLGIEFLPVTVTTSGDADQRAPLGGMGLGVFVKEIEYRLEMGEIDMAVHSLKDMPTALPDGMCIGAVLERADPRDVFVSHLGTRLDDFPLGKRIGTSSPRRRAQLARRRADLEIVPIRGNVDTRLRKAAGEECDGTIAAAAGLIRMGLEDVITEYLPATEFVPPPGQGAMAVEIRQGDDWMREIVLAANHCDTEASVAAERGFLEALGGGCQTPVGAYAKPVSTNFDDLALTVFLSSTDGATAFRATVVGARETPAELAAAAWNELRQQGAGSLLASS